MSSKRYRVQSLGCKANFVDGQIIEKLLQDRGWTPALQNEDASLCIVNSCTVTDEADRQSRKLASRMASKNPNSCVVITGCAAEVDPERLAGTPGVRYIIGNSDKPRLVDLLLEEISSDRSSFKDSQARILGQVHGYPEMASKHPMDRDWPDAEAQFPQGVQLEVGNTLRTRSFLKIQDGCNSFCTFCVIPYGRGPSRSQPAEQVVQQILGLIEKGAREVVLTGTNIGDYGADWGEEAPNGVKLAQLVERILKETSLERLRLSSLDPTEITPDLIDWVKKSNSRLCPHFHVSLQSPHSRVLRAMKRRYTFVEVERCLNAIREQLPEAFIGMDLITGFPGETPEEFEKTCSQLQELPWTRLHVFPYSERQGTPATRIPGAVPLQERQRRAKVLLELSRKRQREHYERRVRESGGQFGAVLIERPVQLSASGNASRAS
ncbi:MAG: tRNA (N(6)-L-threonylcarbamoyladenosine(37)-C(2))-methylthiotransferase MtaB, partial [Bdellovibrionales bacterium]|nr:tRNA (N(6)-L-threonylcarbamoyladenosine(37)-C(2))-methylthiotransferase MtaB [Bdellovibrionales bacterium]